MDFSNRFDWNALLVFGALFLACGPTDQTVDPGSTGGGGTGGSGGSGGGSGTSDAASDTPPDPPGDMDATSTDATQDRSSPPDGASSDGLRDPDVRMDAS